MEIDFLNSNNNNTFRQELEYIMNRRSIAIVVKMKNSGSNQKKCAVVVPINSTNSKDLFETPATIPSTSNIHTDKFIE